MRHVDWRIRRIIDIDKGQRVPTITSVFYHCVLIDIAYDDDGLGMIHYPSDAYNIVNLIHTIIGQSLISWACIDDTDTSSPSTPSTMPLVTQWRNVQYFFS
jgi:hypothetical protein